MAPQNKRANTAKAPVPAKKAKVQVEQVEDPLTLQLNPILAALSASATTAACCDTLRAALPHCLADVADDRHSFQSKMLDLTVSALSTLVEEARTELAEAEKKAETLRSDSTVAKTDFEAAQGIADAKKAESEAKGAEVETLSKDVDAAKQEVEAAAQKKEAFLASKAGLFEEQAAFQTVIDDMWQPLKEHSMPNQQWRKRDKLLNEMVEKIKPLALEGSLVDALLVGLKMKVEQRSSFAQKALMFTEEAFEKHKAALAERIAGAAGEEAANEQAVVAAEAKLAEVKGRHAAQDKEWDEFQNAWAELETKAGDAKTSSAALENDVESAVGEVEEGKTELNAALEVAASFTTLRERPAVLETVAAEPVATEEVSEVPESAVAMQTEVELVAAAA